MISNPSLISKHRHGVSEVTGAGGIRESTIFSMVPYKKISTMYGTKDIALFSN